MRRGDCCLLEWKDVDLARNFITVKTAKTGQTVAIPIFPLLQEELRKLTAKRAGHVFPDQAEKYISDPVGISKRVRELFASAGFRDLGEDEEAPEENEAVGANGYRAEIHFQRKQGEGLRRASVRDFHSFRVTWVTIALTGGVPLELVQKVTGHKTTDIVLKHYFQPGREDFRQALHDAMPKLLTNGQKTARDKMLDLITQVKQTALRERMLALLPKV